MAAPLSLPPSPSPSRATHRDADAVDAASATPRGACRALDLYVRWGILTPVWEPPGQEVQETSPVGQRQGGGVHSQLLVIALLDPEPALPPLVALQCH